MRVAIALLIATLAGVAATGGQTIDLSRFRLVDLTHPLNAKTVFWPTSPTRFELKTLSRGMAEGGYFYSAYSFCMPEHGGTHLDAPFHFSEHGRTADQVPLNQLIAPAVVIDVVAQASADRNYRLTPQDVLAFEKAHGRIQPGTIVLIRTGWSSYWPDVKQYLGDDTPGDASKLSFPGYGVESARVLVEDRKVAALGVDSASIDYGPSKDFAVHRFVYPRNVPGLENLTGLEQLPPRGATLIALPIKIEGGSGGPVRVVALVPSDAKS